MIVLPFNGCVLAPILDALVDDGRIELSTRDLGFGHIYTIAEMLQRLRYCRGDVEIPHRLRKYCSVKADLDPAVDLRRVERADMVLLEPNTVFDLYFGPYALHRGDVLARIVERVSPAGSEIANATNAWFYQGILNRDRDIQREAAEIIIPALAGRVDDDAMAAKLLREIRGVPSSFEDYLSALAEFRDLVSIPIGVVTFVHQFLPNGRPMPWPVDFLENTLEAAKRLNLRVFDTAALVRQHGVEVTHDAAREFFRKEFYGIAGDALMKFCRGVVEQASASYGEADLPAVTGGENIFGAERAFVSGAWEPVRATRGEDRAPDSTPAGLVAVKLIEDFTPADAPDPDSHDIRRQILRHDSATEYVMSFFAAAAERKSVRLLLGGDGLENRAEARFDLRRGVVDVEEEGRAGVTEVLAGMIPVADGWWWCWLSGKFGAVETMAVEIALCNGIGHMAYRGDGRSGVWIAGPRLERNSRPTLDLTEQAGHQAPAATETLATDKVKRSTSSRWRLR